MSDTTSITSRKAKPTPSDLKAAKRLKQLWDSRDRELGITQTNFSERAHVDWSQGAVSQYINGKIPLNYNALLAFSRVLGFDPAVVRSDLPEQVALAASSAQKDEDWPDVVAHRIPASLGTGYIPDEWMETHKLKFRADSLHRKRLNPEKLGIVYGKGDSMLPVIKNGDAIMFDMRRTDPADGALFVITYDGGLMAKQLTEIGGRWFIESLNKDDPKWRKPIPIDEVNGITIHGRVVWIGSWVD